MKRDLARLSDHKFDVLVVGGGIHGACIAWDATSRGLSVALIEKGDFGEATSANSLKTVHGGLRYLQDANLTLVRKMIRERRAMLRIAPHLVHPLGCVMPTYPKLMKSKPVMAVALKLNDAVGFDRNNLDDPEKHLPASRILSRDECLQLLPGIPDAGVTGAAMWYDGQIYNTERMTLAFIRAAAEEGAAASNYMQAIDFLRADERITGVIAKDTISGAKIEISADMVVNAAGPWVDAVLNPLHGRKGEPKFHHSLAMNLVTRQLFPTYAAGIPTRPVNPDGRREVGKRSQTLFIAPWREYSLVGTHHTHYQGQPDGGGMDQEKLEQFIADVNSAYPQAELTRADVRLVHKGLLPAHSASVNGDVRLVREGQVYDHSQDDGIEGLITVVGVKYTSSREVAQEAVDLVFEKMGRDVPKCRTTEVAVWGGKIDKFEAYLSSAKRARPAGVGEETIRRLVYNYGSEYGRILELMEKSSTARPDERHAEERLLEAEITYAVQNEMACKLSDVILRRTEIGSAGHPGERVLQYCAGVMARVCEWNETEKNTNLCEVEEYYAKRT
jgi:glycerol-3-phosphate dehydrogenase